MTNKEYLQDLLAIALRKRGENGSSVKAIREQLASLEYFEKVDQRLGTETFHIGARGEASEDVQPGEYREDIYGNPILSPEERAEAEERQQEE